MVRKSSAMTFGLLFELDIPVQFSSSTSTSTVTRTRVKEHQAATNIMDHPVNDIKNVIRSLTQGNADEQARTVFKYFAKGASFTHPFCRVPSFKDRQIPFTNTTNLDSRAFIIAIYRWYKLLSPRISLSITSVAFDHKTNTLYVRLNQDFSIWFLPFHNARRVELVSLLSLEARSSFSSQQQPTVNGTATNLLVEPLPHHPPSEASTDGETLYDAASETRHLIQEGEKPSFSEVAAGEASAPSSPITVPAGANGGNKLQKLKQSGTASGSQGQSGQGDVKYYITHQEDLYQVTEFLKFISLAPGSMMYGIWQVCAAVFCVFGAILLGPLMQLAYEAVGIGKQKGRELRQEGREVMDQGREVVQQGRQVVGGVVGDAKQVVNGVVDDAKGVVNGVVGEAGNWIMEEVVGLKDHVGKAGEKMGERMQQDGKRLQEKGEKVRKAEI
ncbi:hypothetical protein QC762_603280 [Podospora pseudocomata]|uniref:SigF-like NTF2-like domain-containing protein n=1 Tax=Podospora pseudocomata TaxID=2093779 RepID=A0ABR0G6W3_9PEZI|nr:hypothetical protein QC762_603280 [Podospora pseudocomata]